MEPKIAIGAILCGFIAVCLAQEDLDTIIGDIFKVPNGTDTTQTGTTTQKPTAVEIKGDAGCKCVEYYLCDPVTKTIIKNGSIDGYQLLDIRFGENQCDHYLDVCCNPGDDDDVFVPEPVPLPTDKPGPGPVTPTPAPTPRPTPRPTPTDAPGPGPTPTIPIPTARPPPNTPIPCGTRNNNGIGFLLSGNSDEAQFGEFPWMVAVLKKNYVPSSNDVLAQCGGSLIHPQVVLTGAHCVFQHKAEEMKIRAGEWDTQTTKEQLPFQERDVKQIIVHKDFSKRSLANDVALLVLESPVLLDQHISTVCLPPKYQEFTQKNCIATGWGKTQFGKEGVYQVILKKIELPIVDKQQCQAALRTTRLGALYVLHHSFICAGGEPGKDTCRGDGGSPLVCSGFNGRYQQAGIVAWGIGCGETGVPGVYAEVSQFRDWIDDQMFGLQFGTQSYENVLPLY